MGFRSHSGETWLTCVESSSGWGSKCSSSNRNASISFVMYVLARDRKEVTGAVDGVRSDIHSSAVPISNHNTLGHRKPGSSVAMTCGRTWEDVFATQLVKSLGLRVRIPLGHECLSLVTVVRCQVEVSATGQSLAQRSPTVCVCECVTECDQVQHSQEVWLRRKELLLHSFCHRSAWPN